MTKEELEIEAEEYIKANNLEWELECHRTSPIGEVKQAYQKGAEFGYNKANEWNYPSKGEYPEEECENVWCYCKGLGFKFCCVGHTIVGGDNKVRWWANNKTEELRVIAWKEIVLPKE